jgi:antitoxin component of MazEF toxin-antitoxin module
MDQQTLDLHQMSIYIVSTFRSQVMKLNIQKWGNSAAIRLPTAMLAQIGAGIGDSVEVDPAAFRVAKPKYKLADLLAEMPDGLPMVDGWDTLEPVGKENPALQQKAV